MKCNYFVNVRTRKRMFLFFHILVSSTVDIPVSYVGDMAFIFGTFISLILVPNLSPKLVSLKAN